MGGKHNLTCLACGRKGKEIAGVNFFQIPEKIERRAKWLRSINKEHLLHKKISRDYRLCQRHFSKDMFGLMNKRLKISAVPSLNISTDKNPVVILNRALPIKTVFNIDKNINRSLSLEGEEVAGVLHTQDTGYFEDTVKEVEPDKPQPIFEVIEVIESILENSANEDSMAYSLKTEPDDKTVDCGDANGFICFAANIFKKHRLNHDCKLELSSQTNSLLRTDFKEHEDAELTRPSEEFFYSLENLEQKFISNFINMYFLNNCETNIFNILKSKFDYNCCEDNNKEYFVKFYIRLRVYQILKQFNAYKLRKIHNT